MIRPEEIGYADELLADGTVHRTYEDGLEEWRRRTPGLAAARGLARQPRRLGH